MFLKKDNEYRAVEKMIDRKVRQIVPSERSGISNYQGGGAFGDNDSPVDSLLKLYAYVSGVLTAVTTSSIKSFGSIVMTSTNNGTVTLQNEIINDPNWFMSL